MTDGLQFREDGTFTILQLTDMHIGSEPWNDEDERTLSLTARLIAQEQPDLIVYTGDLIWSVGVQNPIASFRRAISPAIQSGIAWAVVFGNHDAEENVTREQLMAIAEQQAGCLSMAGPSELNGIGNYALEIGSSKADKAAAILYFFDSGATAPESVGGYDWIRSSQVEWYRKLAKDYRLQNEAALPALAFFHIPLSEYKECWELGAESGTKGEEVCCPKLNSGLFAAMVESCDVTGTFAGHDHDNDYCGTLHGIKLCFGRVSGYNTYGSLSRGGRVIRLTEGERAFETWLALDEPSRLSG